MLIDEYEREIMRHEARERSRLGQDLDAIRQGLKWAPYVRMACFNRAEAQQIAASLSPDERARTLFAWQFGGPAALEAQP